MKYDLWDYGVYSDWNKDTFYKVDENAYTYNLAIEGRVGHPSQLLMVHNNQVI